MLKFAVSEEKNQWLKKRMEELEIFEKDIVEKFVRSSGHGGQNVNKTATCVYLKHLPTGIEIKCMKDRNQSVNRFLARRELIKRVERLKGIKSMDDIKIEKIRKQKKKRYKRARIKDVLRNI